MYRKVVAIVFVLNILMNTYSQESGINAQLIMYVATGERLNLRKNPTVNSEKIVTLPIFTKITSLDSSANEQTIDGITSRWYKVEIDGEIGWVFGGYLSTDLEYLSKIIGVWKTGISAYQYRENVYQYREDGTYSFFRTESSLVGDGKWTLAGNYLIRNGIIEDDFGTTRTYTEKLLIEFFDANHMKLVYKDDGEYIVFERRPENNLYDIIE